MLNLTKQYSISIHFSCKKRFHIRIDSIELISIQLQHWLNIFLALVGTLANFISILFDNVIYCFRVRSESSKLRALGKILFGVRSVDVRWTKTFLKAEFCIH